MYAQSCGNLSCAAEVELSLLASAAFLWTRGGFMVYLMTRFSDFHAFCWWFRYLKRPPSPCCNDVCVLIHEKAVMRPTGNVHRSASLRPSLSTVQVLSAGSSVWMKLCGICRGTGAFRQNTPKASLPTDWRMKMSWSEALGTLLYFSWEPRIRIH